MTSSYSAYINPSEKREPTKYIDFDILKTQNPENLCTVSVYSPRSANTSTVTGIIDSTSRFSIGAKAQYQDYMQNLQTFTQLQQYQGLIGSATDAYSQVSLQSLRLSEQNYMGSTVNDINLTMNIPIISKNDDPWKISTGMLEYVLGERASDLSIEDYFGINSEKLQSFVGGAQKELLIYAPHRYRVKWASQKVFDPGGDRDEPEGCASVVIGSRFNFRKVLITSVDCSFNNLVYHTGSVTNLQIIFSFKPWRTPDLNEMKSWFSKLKG